LKTNKLAIEATAKRDMAGRLKTLATELSLSSDKIWLIRRARQLEHDAAGLEMQAVSLAAGEIRDRR
jgi:hypothetical protein